MTTDRGQTCHPMPGVTIIIVITIGFFVANAALVPVENELGDDDMTAEQREKMEQLERDVEAAIDWLISAITGLIAALVGSKAIGGAVSSRLGQRVGLEGP